MPTLKAEEFCEAFYTWAEACQPDRVPELLADEYTDELRQFADKHAGEIDVAVGKCFYTTLMIHHSAGLSSKAS
jgi:class 3 adenylate cyclase